MLIYKIGFILLTAVAGALVVLAGTGIALAMDAFFSWVAAGYGGKAALVVGIVIAGAIVGAIMGLVAVTDSSEF